MREDGLKSEGGWPSGKLRLTLLISFGGLLALMVIAGLDALRLARQLHTQEEEIRQTFLAHSQPLLVLSSSIYVYNDRIQEYLLSQDPQADGVSAREFSRLAAEINSTVRELIIHGIGRQADLIATFGLGFMKCHFCRAQVPL